MDASTIVDLVIAVLVIEVVVLAAVSRRFGRLPRLGALLPNLAAGLFLVLALRRASAGRRRHRRLRRAGRHRPPAGSMRSIERLARLPVVATRGRHVVRRADPLGVLHS